MVSKFILDSPGILEETLVNLTEGCRCFPVRVSRPAIERWLRRGSRGAILESVLICGKRYTSKEAIDRFIRKQLQVEEGQKVPKCLNAMSERQIKVKARQFGLPEPMNPSHN